MANNITVKDAAAASQVVKTTDTAGVHTPHQNIDSIAAGNNNIGDVDVASLPALAGSRAKFLKHRLPYGPFLIAATAVLVLFGDGIINWYKALTGY